VARLFSKGGLFCSNTAVQPVLLIQLLAYVQYVIFENIQQILFKVSRSYPYIH